MRRAQNFGQLTLLLQRIGSNDFTRSCDFRSVNRCQTNPTAANHDHGFTRCHIGRVEDGSGTRGHCASEQSSPVQRHILVDRDAGVLMDQHLLAE